MPEVDPKHLAALATLIFCGALSGCDLQPSGTRVADRNEGQASGQPTCISPAEGSAVSLTGTVSAVPYALPGEVPGAPDTSPARTAFVMTLDAPSCWERGDGATTADRVQLLPVDAEVGAALAAAVGRRIVAQGDAVEAHSPHHRAPVVVLVERISADGVKAPASGAKR